MKRFLIILLSFMMLIFTGCPGGEETKSDDNKIQVEKTRSTKIDKTAAREFMDNYMRYMMRGNNAALKSFYSDEIKEKTSSAPEITNPGPVGFKLEEGEENDERMEFTAHIYSASTDTPYYSDDTYKYTLKLEEGKILIDKIEKDKTTEIFTKGNTLYKREGDKVKGEALLTLDDFPLFSSTKGGSEEKYSVPRDSFGPCAITPDGKSFIVSSSGDGNSFIAAVEVKDTQETLNLQGGEDGMGGGGKGGKGQQGGQEQGQEQKGSEKEISLKPIDLYLDTKITGISFAPNGKMIAVEVVTSNGLTRVNIYKGKEWEQVKSYMDKHFAKDRFSIKKPYFIEDNKMVFTVEPIKNATSEELTLKGDWFYDVKDDKVTQIK